ncbi:MAG: acetyl-CoA carboxylase carboxyl transferase subunit beta [Thermoleophilia bacterium]|nr:acetyl-CoA carboxylase carboxyl transferase subunit beta [Thermoleophilia bacterium]
MARRQIHVSIDRLRGQRDEPAPRPQKLPSDDRACPTCASTFRAEEMRHNLNVCAACGYHWPVGGRERVAQLSDDGAYDELWTELRAADPLRFVDIQPYPRRVEAAEAKGTTEALVCADARIGGRPCVIAVMDFSFLGGSMGSVVGEKFARACERAADRGVPLVTVSASGGARMQEGVLALMQMAKTIVGFEVLRDAGVPVIVVLAHPTTGGVWASFASVGDVTYAEPGALIAFSGPRVIEQTTREKLPEDFGRAESQLSNGHVDAVVDRRELSGRIGRLLGILEQPPPATASLAMSLAQNGTERAARMAQALPSIPRRLRQRVLGGEPPADGGPR